MNENATLARRAQGAIVLSVFGTAWLLWGVAVGFPSNYGLLAIAAAAGGALFVAARRVFKARRAAVVASLQPKRVSNIKRQFRTINIAQWVAVALVGCFLPLTGKQALVIPAVVAIVGIHFLPLGVLYRYRAHLMTGAALIADACANPIWSNYLDHQAGVGIGAGVVLLTSAAYGLAGAL